jgi:hypothetical protein
VAGVRGRRPRNQTSILNLFKRESEKERERNYRVAEDQRKQSDSCEHTCDVHVTPSQVGFMWRGSGGAAPGIRPAYCLEGVREQGESNKRGSRSAAAAVVITRVHVPPRQLGLMWRGSGGAAPGISNAFYLRE